MEKAPLRRVAFFTLGCKVNQYDTEAMRAQFVKSHYSIVNFDEDADVYVINTCTVTNLGDKKSRQMIRRAHRKNPLAIIAVVGCYAQRAAEEVLSIPGVKLALGTKNRARIVEYVERILHENILINGVEDIMKVKDFEETPIASYEGKTRAILKIQEGCSQFCTYCIIPYARGPIRSRAPESVYQEVVRLTEAGYKEVVLTGIHIASYGKDLKGADLISLLRDIHPIKQLKRIRIGSVEPTLLTDKFIREIKELDKVCRHFHVSLQSGCDETLKRMNRRYTTKQYYDIVAQLRVILPEVAITTDIMAGFPGETEEEFEQTCTFVEKMAFSKIHVFQYSPREGTPAATFENQVPSHVKEERSRRLISLGNRLERQYMQAFAGKCVEVLFEEESIDKEGFCEGYTDQYVKVAVKGSCELHGRLTSILIEEANTDYMTGRLI